MISINFRSNRNLSTFHAQESEHGEYGEQGGRCVRDDVGQGVVAGNVKMFRLLEFFSCRSIVRTSG